MNSSSSRAASASRAPSANRSYMVAALGFLALVPLILFAALWVRSEFAKGQQEVESVLGSQAAALSQRIDQDIEPQFSVLRALSSLPEAERGNAASFATLAERVLPTLRDWTGLALVNLEDGRPLSGTRPDWPPAIDGRALAQVRDARRPVVLTAGPPADQVYVIAPVLRGGDASTAIVAAFAVAHVRELADRQGGDPRIMLSILDETGRVLARTNAPSDRPDGLRPAALIEAVRGHEAGFLGAKGQDGEDVFNAFNRSSRTGWTAVVTMSQRQIERMSTRSVWATIAAGTLSLILAGILIMFVAYTVTERRVSDERLRASRALGELDARLLATTQEALGEQRKAASEREVLLREIYHRVKNNLQIIQSLLRLGARDLKPEQREPFEGAVRRIGAMARVHTLLYNSPDLASIDLKDYLEELLRELSDGFAADERSIESILDAHSMRIPLDTAVPLAFIAVEILTNAFRHAFPGGRSGRIQVEVRHDEPFGTLRITDDGIGITPDPAARQRLGLTIVRKLVQQIGGTLEEPPPGSATFLIRFPLPAANRQVAGSEAKAPVPEGSAAT